MCDIMNSDEFILAGSTKKQIYGFMIQIKCKAMEDFVMAGMATKMVAAYCEAQGVKVTEIRGDVLRAGWNFEGGSIEIFFRFDEKDEHVHLEGMNFITVPENKYDAMYKTVNQCNDDYTHIKFVLDTKDGQINAREDAVIQLDSCGEECFELMIRMVRVVEDAFPKFMKAMWA